MGLEPRMPLSSCSCAVMADAVDSRIRCLRHPATHCWALPHGNSSSSASNTSGCLQKMQLELREKILDTRVKLHEAEARRDLLAADVRTLRRQSAHRPQPTPGPGSTRNSGSTQSYSSSGQSHLLHPTWRPHPGPGRSPPLPQPPSLARAIPGASSSQSLISVAPPRVAQSLTDLPPVRAHLMRAAPTPRASRSPVSPTPQPVETRISLDFDGILRNCVTVQLQHEEAPQYAQHAQQAVAAHRSAAAECAGRAVGDVQWIAMAPFWAGQAAQLSFDTKLKGSSSCASYIAAGIATSLEMTLLQHVPWQHGSGPQPDLSGMPPCGLSSTSIL